jgi:hypothetical protein
VGHRTGQPKVTHQRVPKIKDHSTDADTILCS